jgi:hypothetical protein
MNERLKELIEECTDRHFSECVGGFETFDKEKFADLIIRECIDITSGLSKLFPRTDVAFDVGYTTGTTRATKEIKKHFGVQE